MEIDYEKARKYFEEAAEKGNSNAIINIGYMYLIG